MDASPQFRSWLVAHHAALVAKRALIDSAIAAIDEVLQMHAIELVAADVVRDVFGDDPLAAAAAAAGLNLDVAAEEHDDQWTADPFGVNGDDIAAPAEYVCEHGCGFTSPYMGNMVQHERGCEANPKRRVERLATCRHGCGYTTTHSGNIGRHEAKCKNRPRDTADDDDTTLDPIDPADVMDRLAKAEQDHPGQRHQSPPDEHGNYICDVCGDAFESIRARSGHMTKHRDHVTPRPCAKGCGQEFTHGPSRVNHERACDGTPTPWRGPHPTVAEVDAAKATTEQVPPAAEPEPVALEPADPVEPVAAASHPDDAAVLRCDDCPASFDVTAIADLLRHTINHHDRAERKRERRPRTAAEA